MKGQVRPAGVERRALGQWLENGIENAKKGDGTELH